MTETLQDFLTKSIGALNEGLSQQVKVYKQNQDEYEALRKRRSELDKQIRKRVNDTLPKDGKFPTRNEVQKMIDDVNNMLVKYNSTKKRINELADEYDKLKLSN